MTDDFDADGNPTPEAVARWREQMERRHRELFPFSSRDRLRLREAIQAQPDARRPASEWKRPLRAEAPPKPPAPPRADLCGMVLAYLRDKPGQTAGDLAEATGRSKSVVHDALKRAVNKGFVRREAITGSQFAWFLVYTGAIPDAAPAPERVEGVAQPANDGAAAADSGGGELSLLDRVLARLTERPLQTARELAAGVGVDSGAVIGVLWEARSRGAVTHRPNPGGRGDAVWAPASAGA